MKFKIRIAFPIFTFHHQNFTRYHVHLVHITFFLRKKTFDCSAVEPLQAT